MKIIRMTPEEINALIALMDSAVRYDGLKSVNNIAALMQKIKAAEDEKPKRASNKSK